MTTVLRPPTAKEMNIDMAREAMGESTPMDPGDAGEYTELADHTPLFCTEKAVLIQFGDGDGEEERFWFPLSQLRIYKGNYYAPDWLMKEKGLIG